MSRSPSGILYHNLYFGTHTLDPNHPHVLPRGPAEASPYLTSLDAAVSEYLKDHVRSDLTLGLKLELLRHTFAGYLVAEGHPQKLSHGFFNPLQYLIQGELQQAQAEPLPHRLLELSLDRPPCRPDLEQLPCLLSTSYARAQLASQLGHTILLLGDDDLLSLSLPPERTLVLEIDPLLGAFLEERGARVRRHDLKTGLPPDLLGRFDVVVADPPYALEGALAFLECARAALKPGGKLVLCLNRELCEEPLPIEEPLQLYPAFNRYPYPESLRDEAMEYALRYDMPESLARLLFSPPFLYSDLYVS